MQKQKQTEIWLSLCKTFVELYDGDIRKLFDSLDNNVDKIRNFIQKEKFTDKINNNDYKFYCVYYPVGNGRFNINKSIEDINWIIENEINK